MRARLRWSKNNALAEICRGEIFEGSDDYSDGDDAENDDNGDFPDGLETCQMVWKLSRLSGNFPDGLETFLLVWKLFRLCGNFPGGLQTF